MVLTPWVLPRPVCCDRCPHTARPRENAPRYNLEQAVRTERNGYQHTHMPTHTHSLAHTFAHSLTRTHTYTHTHTLTHTHTHSHPHSLTHSLTHTHPLTLVISYCSHGKSCCCFSLQAVMRCIIAVPDNERLKVCNWYYQ